MMDDIKKGLINCILIRDLSRLGCNYIEMERLINKVFPFMGVRFISINDNLDTLNGLEYKISFEVEIKNLVNGLYAKDISKKSEPIISIKLVKATTLELLHRIVIVSIAMK